MRFKTEMILARREFIPGDWGPCGMIAGLIRILINTFVLALVLTWIDYYYSNAGIVHAEALMKSNAIIALSGLLTMRILYLFLNNEVSNLLAYVLLPKIIHGGGNKIFPLLMSALVVFILKQQGIAEYGLVFSSPGAVIFSDVFCVLSLRTIVLSYGIQCH